MNFLKYTFTGRFSIIVAFVLTIGLVLMGVFYRMHKPLGWTITFFAGITFFVASIIYRLIQWIKYRRVMLDNELRKFHKYWNEPHQRI
jgi:hypothetical protein